MEALDGSVLLTFIVVYVVAGMVTSFMLNVPTNPFVTHQPARGKLRNMGMYA
jgi:hypothetical protein